MSRKEIRRSMPLLSIGTVMKLTELSARQIRYYEEHELISPERTEGNRRLYSLNDVDQLLEIKDLLDQGINLAGIKKIFNMKHEHKEIPSALLAKKQVTDEEIRKRLRQELLQAGRFQRPSQKLNDIPRYFH
ncbi:MerR family transcriptional regulator [Heyndrickxia ginsengihumi]|uniref:MerR family transcriptional regulator n=1 Tax=Heyndrickxia ginsengihumi TaxID=363870 RepID=A0A0A6VDU2_9BACI|nr:MerR family transcriptional regulator [Heyndrickxia ginsengihumi]KHD85658.1 MerR family transcriptional regulator [Heyndrickxia ginsengihumi]MBE6184126.1 MerR family transcriptional regulator [Bacillus sp. (in: firmicutes)]MCM3024902.1 MerR family transcriptional regulator [Heyndrickxia ginsengihumi]NEY20535.1 MerR family transcriptional regulator [Heyndrickxia ginsengihumi]